MPYVDTLHKGYARMIKTIAWIFSSDQSYHLSKFHKAIIMLEFNQVIGIKFES